MAILAFFGVVKEETPIDEEVYVNGKTAVISLASNPTTGYEWSYEIVGSSVEFKEKSYTSDDKTGKLIGAGGTDSFTFEAVKDGKTTVIFTYARSWEATDSTTRTFTFTVSGDEVTVAEIK